MHDPDQIAACNKLGLVSSLRSQVRSARSTHVSAAISRQAAPAPRSPLPSVSQRRLSQALSNWAAAGAVSVARKVSIHRRFSMAKSRRQHPRRHRSDPSARSTGVFQMVGKRTDEATPMTVDAIFPIHSVTKTLPAVAAMMLVIRERSRSMIRQQVHSILRRHEGRDREKE